MERRRDAILAFVDSIEVSAGWVTFHIRPIAGDRWSFNVRMETLRRNLEKPLLDLKKHMEWTLAQAGHGGQEANRDMLDGLGGIIRRRGSPFSLSAMDGLETELGQMWSFWGQWIRKSRIPSGYWH